jgi:vitamin-K-epoxide reductase (warfarin-sensitive)
MPAAMKARHLYIAIAALAVAGVIVSSVSLQHHFSTSQESFCNLSATVNCDIVNRSVYSKIGPVPVAAIGILGYLALLALSTIYRDTPQTPAVLLGASLIGLAFALYLTYIEGFVLATWCILCLTSLELIFDIAVLSAVLKFKAQSQSL